MVQGCYLSLLILIGLCCEGAYLIILFRMVARFSFSGSFFGRERSYQRTQELFFFSVPLFSYA